MKYKIIIVKEKLFSKDIGKIGKIELDNIFDKLESLKKNIIQNAQVKRLKNYNGGQFRLRVGNYRILFDLDIEKKEIYILRVLHRSKLY